MRHTNFLRGGPRIGGLGGGQTVYVEKVYVLFPPLKKDALRFAFLAFSYRGFPF